MGYETVIEEDVSFFMFTGIEGLDLGEMGVYGFQFVDLTFVTHGESHNGCLLSILDDNPPLLLCSSLIHEPGTVVQVQFLLDNVVIWEGEVVIP